MEFGMKYNDLLLMLMMLTKEEACFLIYL